MAVTRHTQKDIGLYEAKLIGPLTAKQTMKIAPGVILSFFIGIALYNLKFDSVTIFFFCAITMTPFIYFAKAHPYGMEPMDFLKMYYKYHILAPRKRVYKTESFDDVVFTELGNISEIQTDETHKNASKATHKHKKNPDYPDYL